MTHAGPECATLCPVDGEPDEAYQALREFASLGPGRRFEKWIADRRRPSRRTAHRWKATHHWAERLREYDRAVAGGVPAASDPGPAAPPTMALPTGASADAVRERLREELGPLAGELIAIARDSGQRTSHRLTAVLGALELAGLSKPRRVDPPKDRQAEADRAADEALAAALPIPVVAVVDVLLRPEHPDCRRAAARPEDCPLVPDGHSADCPYGPRCRTVAVAAARAAATEHRRATARVFAEVAPDARPAMNMPMLATEQLMASWLTGDGEKRSLSHAEMAERRRLLDLVTGRAPEKDPDHG